MFEKKREEKEVKIGRVILNEDDLKFQVPYNGEVFTMKHLAPYERHAVELDVARRLGGLPRESFSANYIATLEAQLYVDASVVSDESPEWFKSATTCYDDDCVIELYRGLLKFQSEFRNKITGKQSEGNGTGDKS